MLSRLCADEMAAGSKVDVQKRGEWRGEVMIPPLDLEVKGLRDGEELGEGWGYQSARLRVPRCHISHLPLLSALVPTPLTPPPPPLCVGVCAVLCCRCVCVRLCDCTRERGRRDRESSLCGTAEGVSSSQTGGEGEEPHDAKIFSSAPLCVQIGDVLLPPDRTQLRNTRGLCATHHYTSPEPHTLS